MQVKLLFGMRQCKDGHLQNVPWLKKHFCPLRGLFFFIKGTRIPQFHWKFKKLPFNHSQALSKVSVIITFYVRRKKTKTKTNP